MKNPVLPDCELALDLAKYVTINAEAVDLVASRFAAEDMKIPDWRLPVYPAENNPATVDFFMLGNSINFAFRDFDTKKDFTRIYAGQEWRGAMAMWASLKLALDSGEPILDSSYLAQVSDKEVEQIFLGVNQIPLVQERARIFREVGEVLQRKYDGSFYNLVEDSNHFLFNKGKGIVERLTKDFPSFNDSAAYTSLLVHFNKRAQLAPGMLYGRFRNRGVFSVEDIDELTVFADYGLPKTMRHLGMLVYTPELANLVDSQQLIESKSEAEIEMRAGTICAANMLIKKINEYRDTRKNPEKAVNALHIDYKLWSESRNIKSPHHLTKTTDY
jgi:hypothetical protein